MGPKAIAKAFEMKEATVPKRGIGYVAASGSCIRNYGEKEIVEYTDDKKM